MTTSGRPAAEHEPIARVLPMLSVPHLDREFDYLVAAEQSDDAQPGNSANVVGRKVKIGGSTVVLAGGGTLVGVVVAQAAAIEASAAAASRRGRAVMGEC